MKTLSPFVISLQESLPLFNTSLPRRDYLSRALQLLVGWSECGCVGIRLIDHSRKMPYEVSTGFSPEFWQKERELLVDVDSCACTRVCTGKIIPSDAPAISCGGSFSTGDLPSFAASLEDLDLPFYRGACIGEGYGSIAVIPIRHRSRTLGLIHFADIRKDLISPEKVAAFEAVAAVMAEVLDRYEVGDALNVAEQRHERVFRQTRDVVYAVSPDGLFSDINPAGEALLGCRAENLAGKPATGMFLRPSDWEEMHARIIQDGYVSDFQSDLKTSTGETVPVLMSGSMICDDTGCCIDIIGTIHDMTKAHELRQVALEAAELGAWEYRFETGKILWDERCYRQWGVAEGEVVAYEDALSRILEKDAETIDEAIRNAIAGVDDGIYDCEFRVRWPDGSVRWISSHGRVYFEGHGEARHAVRFIGVNRDITLQKREQEIVREAHVRVEKLVKERTADLQEKTAVLKTILETLPVGVGLINASGALEYVNQAMVAIWDGVRYVDGDNFHEYRIFLQDSQELLPVADYPTARVLRTGEPETGGIFDIMSFEERRKTVSISAAPIRFEGRARNGIVLVIEDMTHQQELQKQLLHSQKLESVGALAGGIAHDFNNILMAICGFASHVYDDLQDEELRHSVRQVLRGGERARELTQKLLAFSRQQVTETEVTSVSSIVATATGFLARVIGEDIEIVQKLSPFPLLIRGNPGQIEQVLTNVMVNARDAMPGGGRLEISTGKMSYTEICSLNLGLETEASYGYIRISDTGVGIPEKNLERIFEPYFSTKETGKGTGLGLAIAYGLVRQHDGAISVSSEEGKGTTVTIFLPLTVQPEKREEMPLQRETLGGTETVLIVEDDATIRTYLHFILKKSGYKVVVAENGEHGLEMLAKHDVDVVLSDVIMPGMNGMEMYREMKKVRPDLQVVFASGYSSDILSSKGIDSDRLRFLQKPVTKDTLLKTLRQVLDEPLDCAG